MAKVNHNITQNQYIYLIQSSMIGVGILYLGQVVTISAHQSGWISVLLAGAYPIFIVLCSSYIDKSTGHIEFFEMSIKVFGKVLTYIFTIFFLIDLLIIEVITLSGFTNVLTLIITQYIPPKLALVIIIGLSIYIALYGLTYMGRSGEILFPLMAILLLVTLIFFSKGSLINIKPYIDSTGGIISAIPSNFYSYAGIEMVFLITPFIINPTSVKKASLYASIFVVLFYTFITISVIYYFGWELTSKTRYPLLYALRTIKIPVLTDFRAIFLFLWSIVIFKSTSILFFGISYCSTKIFHIGYKKTFLFLLPLTYFLCQPLLTESARRAFITKVSPTLISFTVLWSIMTVAIIYFKGRAQGGKIEKN